MQKRIYIRELISSFVKHDSGPLLHGFMLLSEMFRNPSPLGSRRARLYVGRGSYFESKSDSMPTIPSSLLALLVLS